MRSTPFRARDRVTVRVLVLLAMVVAAGVLWRVRYLEQEMMKRWQAILEGGSLTTMATVDEWFGERTADADALASNVTAHAELPVVVARVAPPLKTLLSPLMRRGRFVRSWIVDSTGRVLAQSHDDSLRGAERRALREALAANAQTRSSVMPLGPHAASLSFVAPIRLTRSVSGGSMVPAAVILRSDVVRSFAPWAAGRPNAAMSLLATPHPDGTVIIAACPEQEIPVCITQMRGDFSSTPSSLALAQKDTFGIFVGIDSLRLLAHTRYDTLLHWGVIRRVRYSDALVPLYREIAIEGAFLAVLLALAGVGAYAANRGRRVRRLTEQREAARWLGAVVNASTDGIISLDANFAITMINGAVERMLGRTSASLVGHSVLALFPAEAHETITHRLTAFSESTLIQAPLIDSESCVALRQDGQSLPVEASVGRAFLNGAPLFVLGLRDISERMRSERFRQGQRHVLELMASGAPASETMTSLLSVLEREAPDVRYAVYEVVESRQIARLVAAPRLPHAIVEGPLPLPADERSTATRLKSADGQVIGILMAFYEEPRAATQWEQELALAGAHHASIALSGARAVDSIRVAERALRRSERLAAVGRLISGVAHELNNPLSSILHFVEDMLADPRSERDAEALGVILDQARRSRAIVRDLLSFVRQRKVNGEPLSLREVVTATTLGMRPELARAGVTLHVDHASSNGYVLADRAGLEQIVTNLVSNALHAAGSGGDVWISTMLRDDGCHLVVEDSGPGIPDDVLAQIFDPFFTTKPTGEGTGLGLPVTLGIVEQFDGRIAVDRGTAGRGSRFTVILPCIEANAVSEPASAEAVTPPPPAPAQRAYADVDAAAVPALPHERTVLIIDDERAIRGALRRFFTRRHWQVQEATDGKEGLALLEADAARFDLVISDLRMPGLSGIELHDRLAHEQPALLQRVVFSTGDVASADAASFVQRTSCPVLQKPFELRMLDDIIAALASGAATERMVV